MSQVRVLVVEDDAASAELIECRLEKLGYVVAGVSVTGEDAVRSAPHLRPDVVLMDIRLGGRLDGIETADAMRRSVDVPVVYITAHADDATLERAKVTAPFGYILKPFQNAELHAAIQVSLYRHQVERRLRESESSYRSLIENTTDVIMRFDRDCRHLFVNGAVKDVFGLPPEALVGKTPHQTGLPQALCDFAATAVRRVIETGEPIHHEFAFDGPAGRAVLDWRLTPELDAEGQVRTVFSTSREITEQRRLEEALQQAVKLEAVGRLAGGVAHDFNNLLTPIIGYSEMLMRRMSPQDPHRQYAGEIKRMGERAAALTRQLLAFSRKQVLDPKILCLNEVMADLEKMLRRLIGEDIYLSVIAGEDIGKIRADPGQMEQVIVNLAVNARDAMPDGGSLTIETRSIQMPAVADAITAGPPPGKYVQLTIADTGQGMDAETIAHIFEPFFTTKEQGKGTGLGLAMVYGIISQSGGYITVESEPLQGTAFRMVLPCVDESEGKGVSLAAVAPLMRGNETILLVEDDPDVRLIAQAILETHGYRVLAASGGTEALDVSAGHPGPIGLLVSDVVMPGMTGPALAESLRSLRGDLPVLFISGYTEDDFLRHVVPEHGVAYLRKPFTPGELTRKVREVLDRDSAPQPHPLAS